MHEYKTARSVCGFIEFVAWAGAVLCGIAMLISIGTSMSTRGGSLALVALIPALSSLVFCFLVVIMVQMARATMDTSVTSQKILAQDRQHHQELVSALRSYEGRASRSGSTILAGAALPSGWAENAALKAQAEPSRPVPEGVPIARAVFDEARKLDVGDAIEHRGETVIVTPFGVFTPRLKFETLEDAKLHIDHALGGKEAARVDEPKARAGDVDPYPHFSTTTVPEAPDAREYKGHKIEWDGDKLVVNGIRFRALDQAERHIDGLLKAQQGTLSNAQGHEEIAYDGTTIIVEGPHRITVEGRVFRSMADAQVYVDFSNRRHPRMAVPAAPEPVQDAHEDVPQSAQMADGYEAPVATRPD